MHLRQGSSAAGPNFLAQPITASAESLHLWTAAGAGKLFRSALSQPARSVCVSLGAFLIFFHELVESMSSQPGNGVPSSGIQGGRP